MKRAMVVVMLVACGATEPNTESAAQAVVLEAPDPGQLVDLAQCIEVPDPLTVEWIRQRLTYQRSCFESWV